MKTPGTQSVARQPEAAGKKRAINAPVGAIRSPFRVAAPSLAKRKVPVRRAAAAAAVGPVRAAKLAAVRNKVAAGASPGNNASPGEPPSPKGSAFRDSPLAKEEALQIALTLGLLVCAALIVTLFLAYDVYQSFGKWPPVSNVTAAASSSESTTQLPTPFFMR